jgi:hypothetical protein
MKKKLASPLSASRTTLGTTGDIIRVTGFTASPVYTSPGKTITIKMSIKNVTKHLLKKVPWRIVKNKKVLDSGVRHGLPAGDTFRISTTWIAKPGTYFFYGDADPNNILKEPRIRQFNNLPQGIDIMVK